MMRTVALVGWFTILTFALFCRSTTADLKQDGNSDEGKLLVGSFNIQILGRTKMKKTKVVEALSKILTRYDLVAVLEIRDSSQKSFPKLVKKLNEVAGEGTYQFAVGKRTGRTSSKEQTGFVYRSYY